MNNNNHERNTNNHHFLTTGTLHHTSPDYYRPLFKLEPGVRQKMYNRLEFLYGHELAEQYMPELERILKVYYAHKPQALIEREKDFDPRERFSEEDVILITYGDLIKRDGERPLHVLAEFCDKYLKKNVNTIHILPFFPYSSDRGFSVTDFDTVDPSLGSWHDIEYMEKRYQLMFDGVINHISSKSRWFQEFLNGNPYFQDFFIHYDSPADLNVEQRHAIFRPRTSDILTEFMTINGPTYVWTTFSSDQIDLNYHNPEVLMRVLEVLLHYVRRGADIIRLDAVTYLWAEPGTPCIHLNQRP